MLTRPRPSPSAPFLLVLFAVARLGPARVGLIGMLEPVGAGIIAWVLHGESLNAIQIVGMVIVLVGIVPAETARQSVTAVAEPEAETLPEGASPRQRRDYSLKQKSERMGWRVTDPDESLSVSGVTPEGGYRRDRRANPPIGVHCAQP